MVMSVVSLEIVLVWDILLPLPLMTLLPLTRHIEKLLGKANSEQDLEDLSLWPLRHVLRAALINFPEIKCE